MLQRPPQAFRIEFRIPWADGSSAFVQDADQRKRKLSDLMCIDVNRRPRSLAGCRQLQVGEIGLVTRAALRRGNVQRERRSILLQFWRRHGGSPDGSRARSFGRAPQPLYGPGGNIRLRRTASRQGESASFQAAVASTCARNRSRLPAERQDLSVAAKRSSTPSSNAVTTASWT